MTSPRATSLSGARNSRRADRKTRRAFIQRGMTEMIIHIHASDIANAIEASEDAGFEVLCAVMDAFSGDVSAFVDAGYSGSNHHDRLPAFLRDLANEIESAT